MPHHQRQTAGVVCLGVVGNDDVDLAGSMISRMLSIS